jgi:hypothetical protein
MRSSTLPQTFVQTIQQTLRALRTPEKLAQSPLLHSPLILHGPDAAQQTAVHSLQTVCERLRRELQHQHPLAADLLYGRFWEGLTAERMVQLDRPEPQSISRFYQQQEQALTLFAQLWETMERAAGQAQQQNRLLQRLPTATYTNLVGVKSVIDQIVDALLCQTGPAIVAIKGIGGIGKTAAADCAVRATLTHTQAWEDLIWISAKQAFLTQSGISHYRTLPPTQIRLEQIFDDLGEQLDVAEVKQLPLAQKVHQLAARLRHGPHLVVIDNLESVVDFETLVPWLAQLSGPTKFLLTSRQSVPALARVVTIDLDELDQGASLALIHQTAAAKQVADCDGEAVYTLVGGNPLAQILVVSQMRRLPPSVVLAALRTGVAEDLYTYIYHQSWSVLSPAARELLFAIQRAGDLAEWRWLALVYGQRDHLGETLNELIDFSLVYCQGDNHGDRRYGIHRLTSTFLRTEILGWK